MLFMAVERTDFEVDIEVDMIYSIYSIICNPLFSPEASSLKMALNSFFFTYLSSYVCVCVRSMHKRCYFDVYIYKNGEKVISKTEISRDFHRASRAKPSEGGGRSKRRRRRREREEQEPTTGKGREGREGEETGN